MSSGNSLGCEFFRRTEAFDLLKSKYLPELHAEHLLNRYQQRSHHKLHVMLGGSRDEKRQYHDNIENVGDGHRSSQRAHRSSRDERTSQDLDRDDERLRQAEVAYQRIIRSLASTTSSPSASTNVRTGGSSDGSREAKTSTENPEVLRPR